jgi:phage-related protein
MATFIGQPDHGASLDVSLRLRKASFGDGYEQRTPDGLNYIKEVWNLNFTVRTNAEILSHDSFLRANGISFDWITPKGVMKKFKCENWGISVTHDGDWQMRATFEEVFET